MLTASVFVGGSLGPETACLVGEGDSSTFVPWGEACGRDQRDSLKGILAIVVELGEWGMGLW